MMERFEQAGAISHWAKKHGAGYLAAGGLVIYVTLLALEALFGWGFSYPWSLLGLVAASMPAAGVALLYRRAMDEHDFDHTGIHDRDIENSEEEL
jgi:hypothetical protein